VAQRIGKAGLSVREIDVLKLIAHGLSNKEVANELGVTEATAKKHMTSVLTKLGAKDRTHAVRIGLERGIISLE
jgi:DNA-binding NarL/FixJ family response regulator